MPISIPVTSSSAPVYEGFAMFNAWDCIDWINWHKAMVKDFGEGKASDIWAKAWLAGVSRIGGGYGTAPGSGQWLDSVPIDCRTYNGTFKDYISKYPVLKDAVFSGVLGSTVGAAVSSGVGIVRSGTGIVDDVGRGLNKFSSTLKWLVPLMMVLAFVAITYIVYNKYIKTA